jgi:hypothetical protein
MGWREEAENDVHLCRKSDGSRNWACPIGWAKIQDFPRCVPAIEAHAHAEPMVAKFVAPSKPALSKALELRGQMALCGLIRWSYGCSGASYDAWWNEDNVASLLHSKQAVSAAIASNGLRTDILFLGNSHLSQLAVATMCALRQDIEGFWATDMTSGCLGDFGHATARMECFGNATCGMYLARAKLKSGGRILLANNHPWLFQGKAGLDAALRHLLHSTIDDAAEASVPMVDLSSVRAVVLGRWNEASWAELIFRPSKEEHLKRSKLGKPPGSAPGDGVCGNTQRSAEPLQAWETTDVVHFLHHRGFTGNVVLAGMQIPPFELKLDQSVRDAHPNMHFSSLSKLR